MLRIISRAWIESTITRPNGPMVDSKQRSSPEDRPDQQKAEKQPDRSDALSRSPAGFDEAQHQRLLKMGLSFRMLVERTSEHAIFALDREGNVASWNEGAEKIKGYTAKEIIGQHISRFYTAEDIKRGHAENLLKTAEAQGQVTDEGWRVRKDGTIFWADISITALRDKKGVLRG